MPSWGLLKYIETRLQTISFYLKCFFLKKQNSLPASFTVWFLKKSICLAISELFRETGPTAIKRRFKTQLSAFSIWMGS